MQTQYTGGNRHFKKSMYHFEVRREILIEYLIICMSPISTASAISAIYLPSKQVQRTIKKLIGTLLTKNLSVQPVYLVHCDGSISLQNKKSNALGYCKIASSYRNRRIERGTNCTAINPSNMLKNKRRCRQFLEQLDSFCKCLKQFLKSKGDLVQTASFVMRQP